MTGPIGEYETPKDEVRRLKKGFRELREWVEERYKEEVLDRPMNNKYREILRITWQQVMDKLDRG